MGINLARVDREDQGSEPPGAVNAGPSEGVLGTRLRREVVAEIEAMALFLVSEGRPLGEEAAGALARMERRRDVPLPDLIATHARLSQAVAPAKPRALLSLQQGFARGRVQSVLGPTPGVRRLTCAGLFFAACFFVVSLSSDINVEVMRRSIYELSGTALAVKLGLIVSAAGLGASFATLFSVWEDLRKHRFEPLAESASWMQIGLGIVAGLVLAEIIGAEPVLEGAGAPGQGGSVPVLSQPLLALIGGFSAGVLHLILVSIANAFRRAFSPGPGEPGAADALAERMRTALDAIPARSDGTNPSKDRGGPH